MIFRICKQLKVDCKNKKRNIQCIPLIHDLTDSIWRYNHLRHTTTKTYDNNGNGWTFDLTMAIRWAINISRRSPKLEWASRMGQHRGSVQTTPPDTAYKWGARYQSTLYVLCFLVKGLGVGVDVWVGIKTDIRSSHKLTEWRYNPLRHTTTEKYTRENIFSRCQSSVGRVPSKVIETVSPEGTFCDTVQVPSSAGDMGLN